MEPVPRYTIILARLSDLRDDDERGVGGQGRDDLGIAEQATAAGYTTPIADQEIEP